MKKINLTKSNLFMIISTLFCCCLIISNILASKTFAIGSVVLPCAVIIFPIVYIINDCLAEVYGFQKAKRVIFLGFAINLLAVAFYNLAILLPAPAFATESAEAFKTVLSSSARILVGSFAAYLVGSLLNSFVMVKMKAKSGDKLLMLRCVVSTLLGEGVDAIIFITIAFVGTMPVTSLLIMIGAQAAFKTVYEIIVYPLTRLVIKKVNTLQE